MNVKDIPNDFPKHPVGAVSGVQPKVLVRQVDNLFVQGFTDEELLARYDSCQDLVEQFVTYCQRKLRENPGWSMDFTIDRAAKGLDQRIAGGEWDVTILERDWIIARLRARMAGFSGEGVA